MKIRKATKKDFKEIVRLMRDFYAWECELDEYLNPEWSKRALPIRIAIRIRMKNIAIFVAEDKGKLVGFVECYIKKQPPLFIYRRLGEISNLYVEKKYRSKGIGKKLIKASFSWFKSRKVKWANLFVHPTNKRAYKLYRKIGFEDWYITMNKIIK